MSYALALRELNSFHRLISLVTCMVIKNQTTELFLKMIFKTFQQMYSIYDHDMKVMCINIAHCSSITTSALTVGANKNNQIAYNQHFCIRLYKFL